MPTVSLSCEKCRASLRVRDEVATLACGTCGASMAVERDGGAISLRLNDVSPTAATRDRDGTEGDGALDAHLQVEVDASLLEAALAAVDGANRTRRSSTAESPPRSPRIPSPGYTGADRAAAELALIRLEEERRLVQAKRDDADLELRVRDGYGDSAQGILSADEWREAESRVEGIQHWLAVARKKRERAWLVGVLTALPGVAISMLVNRLLGASALQTAGTALAAAVVLGWGGAWVCKLTNSPDALRAESATLRERMQQSKAAEAHRPRDPAQLQVLAGLDGQLRHFDDSIRRNRAIVNSR